MNIFFLAGADSPHSIRWIRYFVEAGVRVTWVSLTPPLPEAEDLMGRAEFHHLHLSPWNPLSLASVLRGLRAILDRAKPDILHAHYAGWNGFLGLLLRFHPHVLSVWGSDVLLNPRNPLKRRITARLLANADLITIDGRKSLAVVSGYGVPSGKVRFVQFGVDTERFAPRGRPRPFTVLSTRTLKPVYDVETIVRAVPAVVRRHPGAEFVIAGEGPERERLFRLAAELGISGSVRFIGRVPHGDLPEVYNRAFVYVSTSLSDSGLSISTAEAMACGLPVVVTDTSDNAEWVEDGRGGYVIPVQRPDLLAEAILRLFEPGTTRDDFGAHNRRVIQERNDYRREMTRMQELYESLIPQPPS